MEMVCCCVIPVWMPMVCCCVTEKYCVVIKIAPDCPARPDVVGGRAPLPPYHHHHPHPPPLVRCVWHIRVANGLFCTHSSFPHFEPTLKALGGRGERRFGEAPGSHDRPAAGHPPSTRDDSSRLSQIYGHSLRRHSKGPFFSAGR